MLKLLTRVSFLTFLLLLSSCTYWRAYWRVDPLHPLIRSEQFKNMEEANAVVARAKLSTTSDGRIRVLYVTGTPYERGFQHGVLLKDEVQDNLNYLYEQALKTFKSEVLFEEVYERMRPFIPQDYIDEMHGLAHGAELPLKVVHFMHVLPSMSEWGGKKRIKEIVKQMIAGKSDDELGLDIDLGTSCSNIGALPDATKDGKLYAVRILDWGLHKISKLHEYPLLLVENPDKGNSYVNITWVGFLGAISGMNDKGITLGEMGYGSPPNETLRGKPMPFLLRDILADASNLADVRRIISTSPGTNSFGFVMTDGKTGEAELYIRDRDRFLVNKPGQQVTDGEESLPPINAITYAGHYDEKLSSCLAESRGQITPQLLMEKIIPEVVMKSNFQNVVYDPADLKFWVSYATHSGQKASEAPYTFFDFGEALKTFSEK